MTQTQSSLIGIRYKKDIKKWEARISIRGKHRSKTFLTAEEAIAWRKNEVEFKYSPASFTCGELLPKWLDAVKSSKKSPQTHERYENMVRLYFLPFFGSFKISEVTDMHVHSFAIFLVDMKKKKPFSPKTIRDMISALRCFFRYCNGRAYIEDNPADTPKFQRSFENLIGNEDKKETVQNIRSKARSKDDVNKILDAAYQKSFEFGLFTEFLIKFGIRLGEAAALTWGDFACIQDQEITYWTMAINKTMNLKTKQVQYKAKCNSGRILGLHEKFGNKVMQWKAQLEQHGFDTSKTDFVFPRLSRQANNYSQDLVALCQKLEIKNTTAHCFRHTCGTLLMTSGFTVQQVQKLLGHADPRMTFHYYDGAFQSTLPMMSAMENMIKPALSQP